MHKSPLQESRFSTYFGPWFTYCLERFYPPMYLFYALGISLSSSHIHVGHFETLPFFTMLFGILILLLATRVVHDHNDYQKDLINHPRRVLSRGDLSLLDARTFSYSLLKFLVVYGIFIGIYFDPLAAFLFLISVGHTYALFKNSFFQKLVRSPNAYAMVRHLYLIPVVYALISLYQPDLAQSKEPFFYGALIYASSSFADHVRRLKDSANNEKFRTLLALLFLLSLILLCVKELELPMTFYFPPIVCFALALLHESLKIPVYRLLSRASLYLAILNSWSVVIAHFAQRV